MAIHAFAKPTLPDAYAKSATSGVIFPPCSESRMARAQRPRLWEGEDPPGTGCRVVPVGQVRFGAAGLEHRSQRELSGVDAVKSVPSMLVAAHQRCWADSITLIVMATPGSRFLGPSAHRGGAGYRDARSRRLLQRAFMGDAILRVKDGDFSTHFGWVTVPRWLVELSTSIAALDRDETSRVAFQEGDDLITMTRCGDWVQLEATYVDGSGQALHAELRSVFNQFARDQIAALRKSYPRVLLNPCMSELLERLGLLDEGKR
jgi:hypothetical protein